MSSRRPRTALAAVTAAVTACTPFKSDDVGAEAGPVAAGVPGDDDGGEGDAGDDAESCPRATWGFADTEAGARCDPDASFDSPAVVPGLTTIGALAVGGLRLSPDYRTGYFNADRATTGGFFDLYAATRLTTTGEFACLVPLGGSGIDTSDDEVEPTMSADGRTLLFQRSPPYQQPSRVYAAGRAADTGDFGDAGILGAVNDLAASDEYPFLREDGHVLYFGSTRVLSEGLDIYRSTWNGTTFEPPVRVDELDTSFDETAPVVTPDDLSIFYARAATSGGQYDIWMATRASVRDPFGAPRSLQSINTASGDKPTFVTRDGCTLYLESDRGGGYGMMYVAVKSPP
jgi:hypothetical protein